MRGKTALQSMLASCGAVDAGRRMEPPFVAGCRQQPFLSVEGREETPSSGKGGGLTCGLAAFLATLEDIHRRHPGRPMAALLASEVAALLPV